MNALGIVVSVLAAAVVAVIVLVVVGLVRLRRVRSGHLSRVTAAGPAEHTSPAHLFGEASARTHQVRGPGTLVLTADELVFVQLLPAREVRVPRGDITSCRRSRSFLGKTQGRDLLVVTWDSDGTGDAVAFDTADAGGWCDRLSG